MRLEAPFRAPSVAAATILATANPKAEQQPQNRATTLPPCDDLNPHAKLQVSYLVERRQQSRPFNPAEFGSSEHQPRNPAPMWPLPTSLRVRRSMRRTQNSFSTPFQTSPVSRGTDMEVWLRRCSCGRKHLVVLVVCQFGLMQTMLNIGKCSWFQQDKHGSVLFTLNKKILSIIRKNKHFETVEISSSH